MITRLGDVATYINGYAFKPSDWSNEGKPIIRIQDLTDNSYQMNRFNCRIPEKYYVKKGDVLISWSASLGVYRWTGEDAVLNQHIFKVVFDKTEVDKEFFIIQAEKILKDAQTQTHGATMKHLTKPMFDSLRFYYPPLAEQREIVMKMGAVRRSIEKRKAQLKKLDDLVKSQFIEMFGDPVENEKSWDVVKLSEIAEFFNGLTYRPEDVGAGTIVLRSSNIQDGELDFSDIVRVRTNIRERLFVRTGDLLMCSRNGSAKLVGKVAPIGALNEPMTFGAFMMIIRSSMPEYLMTYFRTEAFREQIKTGATTTINQITATMLNKVRLPLPPTQLVNQYALFVKQTDKSKVLLTMKLFFHLYTAICLKAFEKSSQMMYNHR